ncbi:MAG TPA: hypothetical protein VF810_05195 [Patescibacteria group bacterium]
MLAKVLSAAVVGLEAVPIEVDIAAQALPSFVVGLPDNTVESSKQIKKWVEAKQIQRFAGTTIISNAELANKTIKEFCQFSNDCINLLKLDLVKMHLSGRTYYHSIKAAHTIADLDASIEIHIAEALQYRPKSNNL